MARKNDSLAGLFLLALAALAIIAGPMALIASVSASLWIVVHWLRVHVRRHQLREASAIAEFGPTRDELRAKLKAICQREIAEAKIARAERRGAGLSKRNDGAFNQVSTLGKQLNAEIAEARQKQHDAEDVVRAVRDITQERAGTYSDIIAGARSGFVATLALILVTSVAIGINAKWMTVAGPWLMGFTNYLPEGWLHVPAAVVLGAGVAWIVRSKTHDLVREQVLGRLREAKEPDNQQGRDSALDAADYYAAVLDSANPPDLE